MTDPRDRMIARLLALADRFASTGGHLDHREGLDYRGVCVGHRTMTGGTRVKDGSGWRIAGQTLSGECAASCREWQAVRAEARAHLDAVETRQLVLIREAV